MWFHRAHTLITRSCLVTYLHARDASAFLSDIPLQTLIILSSLQSFSVVYEAFAKLRGRIL